VRVTVDGPVRRVVLARPDKRNALNAAMLAALAEAFAAEPGPEERVAVISAEGPAFCAGLDLSERLGGAAVSIEEALHAVERYPLPVLAVVQGDAIAGGAELAFHCDLVVASESARVGMSVAQIGLAPSWGLVTKLLDVGGPSVARQLLLLGDPLPAARLAQLGIISAAVPATDLESTADSLAARLAANAPLSMRAIKAALLRAMDLRRSITHEDVDALVSAAARSQDAREGMRARLERRAPRFEGR
jgi:enoyl-CoA hydratase/carnithine racemase